MASSITPTPAPDTTVEVIRDLAATRWSCRAFRPDPLPRRTIEQILDVARMTPSWCNTQPWHLHITEGAATQRLRTLLTTSTGSGAEVAPDIPFPTEYTGVHRQRRRESGFALYESLGIAPDDRVASYQQTLRNFDLFDAPHVAILTTEATLGTYGAVDCGLFVESFLLAAHAHGVAAIPQAALATQAPALREFLDLDDSRQVLLGISFGYADPTHPANSFRTTRQSIDEVASFIE